MVDIIGGFRRKVYPTIAKVKEIFSPDGELIVRVAPGEPDFYDPTPIAPPIGWHRQPSMHDIIAAQVRQALLDREVEDQGMETWDEADDFDVEDDPFPQSPHEGDFDPIDYDGLKEAVEAEKGHGAKAPSGEAEPPTPEPKATPPEPIKKASTTGDKAE